MALPFFPPPNPLLLAQGPTFANHSGVGPPTIRNGDHHTYSYSLFTPSLSKSLVMMEREKTLEATKRIQQRNGKNPSPAQDSQDECSHTGKARKPRVYRAYSRDGGYPTPSRPLESQPRNKPPKPNNRGALYCKDIPPSRKKKSREARETPNPMGKRKAIIRGTPTTNNPMM